MSLADLSIKRPIFITCLVLIMLVVGWVSFKSLSVDLFPDVNFPVITVVTTYPGAGPAEIETLVTRPLEDEIGTISGMKRLFSKSLEGVSQVVAEFRLETDIKYAEQQIRDKVAAAKAKLPRDIKEPVIRRIDPSDQPVLTISVQSEVADGKLYDIADRVIKARLEQVNNVGLVEIVGGRKREIQVALDRRKLQARELSVSAVAAQLGAAGENVPGGKVNEGDVETIFRSLGEFRSSKDISDTVVNLFGNETPTRVSDVGAVYDTLEDEKSRVFVNGRKSLFIDIYRQTGSNTIAVVQGVKKQLERLTPELAKLEGTPKVEIIRDASRFIQTNVDDVKETILIGIILTIVVVYLFLANGRSTLITGLALPNSLIGAFILMAIAGFSINIVTLLSLSLAIGLLIDDAIVVRENIFRHIERGEDPVQAARNGTREVQLAVVATTLVVIAVFAPVAFMKGIVGQFLKSFGLTICFAMAISLFDALTVAPMLSAYFAGARHSGGPAKGIRGLWDSTMGKVLLGFDNFQRKLEDGYEKILRFTLRRPILVLGAGFLVFVASSASLTKVPSTFIPEPDHGEFVVDLDLPPGTNLEAMTRFAAQADQIVRKNPEVALTALTVGGKRGEANQANIYIKLVEPTHRKIRTGAMKQRVREQMKEFANANPKVKDYDPTGGAATQPLTLNLIGNDPEELEKYSTRILEYMKKDPRLKDVDTSYRPGKPEFQVGLKPGTAQVYGIGTRSLGAELRAQVEGVTPAKFREGGQEYDVRVRLKPEQRNLRDEYEQIFVPNINGKLVRLSDVAQAKASQGPAAIDRQDRGRYIQVSAALAQGAGLGEAMADLNRFINQELKLPPGLRYAYIGDSESFQEMGESMVTALGFAVLFIFLVLASLYESFITPFTIMLALPLALCGAFLGLFIGHESLNLFAFLGIVMLLGVASKNSILLVDYAKNLMEEGVSRADALVQAGKTRLRPILMTSMALIAGTIPVAIGLNEASKQRTSMGVAIIGGLITSTLLTLVIVPAAFIYVDRFRVWSGSKLRRLVGARKQEAPRVERPQPMITH